MFTLTYEITQPGSTPMRIMLGASIRGAGDLINDPANDEGITVHPGRGIYQRSFRVPAGTPPGQYDVLWGLMAADGQTSYGFVTQPAALTVRGSLPAVPAASSLSSALSRVAHEGYRVLNANSYDPNADIRVLVGVATNSADGSNQRAFFFAGDRYIGTDARDASATVEFVRQVGNVVTLRYFLYRPADSMCCPSAGTVDVRYRWDGTRLIPLDPIPAADWNAAISRR